MSCASPTVNSRIRASTNSVRTHMSKKASSLSPVTSFAFCQGEKVIVWTFADAVIESSREKNNNRLINGWRRRFPGDVRVRVSRQISTSNSTTVTNRVNNNATNQTVHRLRLVDG